MLKHLSIMLAVVCAFGADVTTFHNDNSRTGQNLSETILTPSNVNSTTFGRLFTISVDGKVDAQPLYLTGITFPGQGTHNALFVATEHGTVYAFDADTGTKLWSVTTLAGSETTSDSRGCGQVSPEIGITSTPVISKTIGANGTIYVVAMSKDSSSVYHQRLHALDLTTGAEQFGGPKEIQASFPGTGDNSSNGNVIFDPKQYKERAALLLDSNGILYTSWASHCDFTPYTGWLMSYSASTLAQINVFNFTPNGSMGAVWMAGGGPAMDGNGNIYFLAANGTFDSTINAQGFPSKGDYGNAFMKVSTINNVMAVADFFAMSNVASENGSDQDLGSGGELLLPDMMDANGVTRHLAVGAGKDRHIYLVDRDNMGKFNSQTNAIYQDLPSALSGGEFAVPAYFNNRLFYGGSGDLIRGFPFTNALLATSPSWTTPNTFPSPGATPSISANGTANGIVWAAANGSTAVLYAFDAGDLHQLYNSNQAANNRDHFGTGNKFITPTVVNGKVYVGTTNGVGVFGLLSAQQTPVITSATTATGTVNSAFSYQITATNNPTGFSASGLPTNLTVNTSTGLISGTPTVSGPFTVTLGATNSGGTGNATLNLTINPQPAPVITSSTTATGTQGTAFSYQITATNSPTSFSASGLPTNLSVNSSTGLISGTPTVSGTFSVTLGATNTGGTGNATLNLTLGAQPVPVITSPTTATATQGTAFSYQITATNSPTTFLASGLPSNLMVNTSTGLISGTPTVTGPFSVTLGATNFGGTGNATLNLTINPPQPVITSPTSATGTMGTPFSYQITATNNPTSYSASGLPTNLTVNPSTGLISGTPTVSGPFTVTLGATNAGGTGNATLNLTINATSAPVITSSGTLTGPRRQNLSYQITATNNPTSYSATGLPAGLTLNTTTGIVTGSVSNTGTTTATINATNAAGTGSKQLLITITKH